MFKKLLSDNRLKDISFRSDFFPTVADRDFWENYPGDNIVALAEAELGYCWPTIKATDFMEFRKSGDRQIMERPHFDRRNHLVLFTLAELSENKKRFLPEIVNGIFAICEETFWGLSAHVPGHETGKVNIPTPTDPYVDLFAAETAEHLVTIANILREPLLDFCPEILDRISYELEVRIKAPYLKAKDWWWLGYGTKINNWNPWIISNLLSVFLLEESDEDRKRLALSKLLLELNHYYDSIPDDGGCDEGPNYWLQAGASLFECVYILKEASSGAVNLFSDEKLGKIASYMQRVHISKALFLNVADASPKPINSAIARSLIFGFGKETAQSATMSFASLLGEEAGEENNYIPYTIRTLRRLIWGADWLRELSEYGAYGSAHQELEELPNLQIASLRKGDFILFAKGGHNNESHNHNDVGSFALYDGATPVLVDVGIGVYTRYTFSSERYTRIPWTRSVNHNLPIVNGVEQSNGRSFEASSFAAEKGKINISFAGAYPADSGLTRLDRALALDESSLIVRDDFSFSGNGGDGVVEVLMSILPVRIEADAAILDEKYRITARGAKFASEWLSFEGDEKLTSGWHTEGVNRITVAPDSSDLAVIVVEKISR